MAGERSPKDTFITVYGRKPVLEALGTKAAALPFTATVDDQGRLASLKVSVPAAGEVKAYQASITMSKYGATTAQATPAAAEVVDAPAQAYDFFNG